MNKRASSEPQTLARGEKKRTLRPKDITFVNHKLQGKSNTRAVMDAGISTKPEVAKVVGSRMANNPSIQAALAQAMQRAGLTLDAVIAPVADALQANKTVIADGEMYESQLADHSTRLKAAGMAHNLMGLTNNNDGSGNVHFHLHAGGELSNYGDV